MCKFFSGVITKNKTFVDYDQDSHEFLIKKAGLKDASLSPEFVRVELLPSDGDLFNHNLENWKLNVDQDFRPEWFEEKWADQAMKTEIQKLWRERFIIDDKSWKKLEDGRFWVKNSSVVARENSSVVARENSSVVAWRKSSVVAWGNSSVVAWENSSVVAWGNSSVEARENSSVVAWENSSVVARENSSVVARENSSVVAWENSSVVARENSSVFIPYSNTIKIKGVYDNATIKDLHDKPVIYVANKKMKLEVWKC